MAKAKAAKEEKAKDKVDSKEADAVVFDEMTEDAKAEVSVDTSEADDATVKTYTRVTPFGVEVWDPKTKSTVMNPHG